MLLSLALAACHGSNPTGPSENIAPPPLLYTIQGTVRQAGNGPTIEGATVRVVDGPNAGKSTTTNGSGQYTLSDLPRGE